MTTDPLDEAAGLDFDDHDPGVIIDAVNGVLPLGKEAALTSIEEAAGGGNAIGLFWVLRTLFDMPPGQGYPQFRWGQPDIPPPQDPATLPRFPLVLAEDVPLLAVHGYLLAGLPEPVSAHIEQYRAHGVLREGPVTPPDDLGAVERDFLSQWRRAYGEQWESAAQELVTAQLARMRG